MSVVCAQSVMEKLEYVLGQAKPHETLFDDDL